MRSPLRWIVLVLAVLLLALQTKLHWGQGGVADVQRLRTRVATQTRDNAVLQQRNAALAAEIDDLKTGTDAIEERARSELGMIKPGEIFYQVIDTEAVSEAHLP
ncbi:MAG: cell division protein FtsB [Lysobacterales bacterium CG02_land_8_20_14_3_00_62_12]|nr:MAG: cell division protein FtsB [Xanthomonadales bacterium CG02_land_8_20_14_3_00_62_12]